MNLKLVLVKFVVSFFILGEVVWILVGIGLLWRRNYWIWLVIVFDCGYRVDNWKVKKKCIIEYFFMWIDIVLSNNIWVLDFLL